MLEWSTGGGLVISTSLRPTRAELREHWQAAGLIPSVGIADTIEKAVLTNASAPIVFWSQERLATGDLASLWRDSTRFAAGLQHLGYRKGDRLAIQVPNWIEGTVALLAAARLGLVIVPIILIYGAAEVGFILRQSGARGIVLPRRWKDVDLAARTCAIADLVDLRHVIAIGDGEGCDSRIVSYDRLLSSPAEELRAPVVAPSDRFALIYTSGTTGGDPKGAIHTHETFGADLIAATRAWLPADDNKVALVCFPPGHVAGLLLSLIPIATASGAVYLDTWIPGIAADLIERYRIGWTFGTPFHLTTLLEVARSEQLRTLGFFGCGGASVPPVLIEQADRAGIKAVRAFGCTEHPSITTGFTSQPLAIRAYTDGAAMDGTSLRIIDEQGEECPVGEVGEVITMGPELFLGYVDASLDAQAFTAEGWYRTGDLGRLDQIGALTIVDRKKDIIIRGGENISSKEVEEIVRQLDVVLDVAVVGWPDRRYGERVCAFVQLRDAAVLSLEEIQRHFAAASVARQKTPEQLVIVTDFQRTAAGKIIKPPLRAEAARLAASRS